MTELWVEKYRPKAMADYVWRDAQQRHQVEKWLKEGALPHLLLSGSAGVGKTSLAEMMLKTLNVQAGDILKINASRERKVDDVIPKILNFCTTWALGDMKYVLLDEVDQFTPHSQRALRGEMESYHDSVRFILTCNYPNKIIPALHSRCQGFHIEALDINEFTNRLADILISENIQLATEEDVLTLNTYVERAYPDLRKCINLLQQNCNDGILRNPTVQEVVGKDYLYEMVNLFKAGQYTAARKLVVSAASFDEYDGIYRFMYENLDAWGETEAQQNEALLHIRDGLVNHTLVADVEINMAATLCKLAQVRG